MFGNPSEQYEHEIFPTQTLESLEVLFQSGQDELKPICSEQAGNGTEVIFEVINMGKIFITCRRLRRLIMYDSKRGIIVCCVC